MTNLEHISAEVVKIGQLNGFNNFRVPSYQRPYVWSNENVQQIIEDINTAMIDRHDDYRIGSIILHENDGHLDIVDGQQRITTILLAFKYLNSNFYFPAGYQFKNSISKENIRSNYNYLSLAFCVIDKEKFFQYLTEHCSFVKVVIDKDHLSEAFQMFDSQNGRGKELEAYNLLKAYHMRASCDTDTVKINMDKQWEAAANYTDGNNKRVDLLKQVINEHLYRSRVWSRGELANRFTKKEIGEFKGVNADDIKYPYMNDILARHIVEKISLIFPMAFVHKIDSESKGFLCSITEQIVNGKSYFEYVDHYVNLYKALFVAHHNLDDSRFYGFYLVNCLYDKHSRQGDTYVRELYKSAVMFAVDRFGLGNFLKSDLYRWLYVAIYQIRFRQTSVFYQSVVNYSEKINMNIFNIITYSINGERAVNMIKKKMKLLEELKRNDIIHEVFVSLNLWPNE